MPASVVPLQGELARRPPIKDDSPAAQSPSRMRSTGQESTPNIRPATRHPPFIKYIDALGAPETALSSK